MMCLHCNRLGPSEQSILSHKQLPPDTASNFSSNKQIVDPTLQPLQHISVPYTILSNLKCSLQTDFTVQ